ncbi:hypothetical protein P4V64_10790 [Bacillus thuringiensis]|uniref:hypothetical protein n=1 Tax=Brevibacillus brevis TaxID=1393 RepID=UPI001F5B5BAA|nr:hypothetical protein [Brevibacillus brevis]MED1915794.1 hypothetical protein [Bacillus thuringiensis]
MVWSRPVNVKKREDLIRRTGTLKHKVTIVDAKEEFHGVDVKVRDFRGEEYWTTLDDVELDNEKDPAGTESLGETNG